MPGCFPVDSVRHAAIFAAMNGAPSNAEIAIGAVLAGKYRIEGTVGVGGMGVVFAAKHLDLDRLVAVKVMRAEICQFPDAVERLTREAKLAARFQGEHVCKVLDVGVLDDGAPYIVMEYLEGIDLATLLEQQGPLDVETAVDFMLQVCEALTEAHTAQIVHRDLKPENLFVARAVDGTPTIKVLDFGISKDLDISRSSRSLTNPSAALGSPHYMAPEQMRSARDVDVRVDIWAVGAILFELVTGRQVFPGTTLPEICASVLDPREVRVGELHSALPPGLAVAIDRALAKDPAMRFKDVGELAVALAPFGSPKAQESRERIQRRLTGNELGAPRLSKDPTGRYVLGPNPRSLSKAGLSGSQSGAVASTDAGAEPPSASSRSRKLALLFAAAALACAIAALIATKNVPETAATVPPAAGTPPREQVAIAAAKPAPLAPPPAVPQSASASSAPPTPSPVAHVPVRAALRQPSAGQARPGASATAAAPAPAPSASARPKKANLADAWDTSSFGPRY